MEEVQIDRYESPTLKLMIPPTTLSPLPSTLPPLPSNMLHDKTYDEPVHAAADLAMSETYPYYRLSTYEICGSKGYSIICDMFLKYYANKVPVCIAYAGRKLYRDDFAAIWLMGEEAMDPKTKQRPNSEPMGEIIWSSKWPGEEVLDIRRLKNL